MQVETITEGFESELLTIYPRRNATVLAHNDFAVDGPAVQPESARAGQIFKLSTCMNIIGVSSPFCMPTVCPVASRTTC